MWRRRKGPELIRPCRRLQLSNVMGWGFVSFGRYIEIDEVTIGKAAKASEKFLNDFENRCALEVCEDPGKISQFVSASVASVASGGGVTVCYDRVLTND